MRLHLQADIESLAFLPMGSWHKWMSYSWSARWHEYFVVHSRSLRSLLAGMHCTVAGMHDVRRRKCFQDPDRNCNAHTHRKMRPTSQTGRLISTTADWKIALSKKEKLKLRKLRARRVRNRTHEKNHILLILYKAHSGE